MTKKDLDNLIAWQRRWLHHGHPSYHKSDAGIESGRSVQYYKDMGRLVCGKSAFDLEFEDEAVLFDVLCAIREGLDD